MAGSDKTLAWLKTHKQEAALGAGGIVVAIALYMKSRANAAANSSSSTSSGTLSSTPASVAYPTGVANTTGTDLYTGLESQISQLQAAITAAQQPAPAPSVSSSPPPGLSSTTPLSNQVIVGGGYSVAGGSGPGGGYGSGILEAPSGAYFSPIATADASKSLFSTAPNSVFYEPSLGNFVPVGSPSQFASLEGVGTTLFSPVGTTPGNAG